MGRSISIGLTKVVRSFTPNTHITLGNKGLKWISSIKGLMYSSHVHTHAHARIHIHKHTHTHTRIIPLYYCPSPDMSYSMLQQPQVAGLSDDDYQEGGEWEGGGVMDGIPGEDGVGLGGGEECPVGEATILGVCGDAEVARVFPVGSMNQRPTGCVCVCVRVCVCVCIDNNQWCVCVLVHVCVCVHTFQYSNHSPSAPPSSSQRGGRGPNDAVRGREWGAVSDGGSGTLGVLLLQLRHTLCMGGATALETPPTKDQERSEFENGPCVSYQKQSSSQT